MAGGLRDRIELFEVVEVPFVPDALPSHAYDPHWQVTVRLRPERGAVSPFTATWFLRKADWPDDAIVPVVRNWLHRLCHKIANETADWELDEEQFASLKRPPKANPQPHSANPKPGE